ncbi:MAG: hypothetical protein ACP5J4_01500 [Anaerolineae bacterium]
MAALHTQVVELSLRRRMLSLQLLNIIRTGAAKLAPLVAAPEGDVVLIPVVWHFVRDVDEDVAADTGLRTYGININKPRQYPLDAISSVLTFRKNGR